MTDWLQFDWQRQARTGVPEAVLGSGKRVDQIVAIAAQADQRDSPLLLTRLSDDQFEALEQTSLQLELDRIGGTAILGGHALRPELQGQVCVVAAGSSDQRVAAEATNTLQFCGAGEVTQILDVGVAGLWRLLEKVELLSRYRVIIAVAGMEGALFSVLAGLVPGLVIAVPSSVGYGVSANGEAALSTALASCSPGVVVVNVDNGFGAACAAIKACPTITMSAAIDT